MLCSSSSSARVLIPHRNPCFKILICNFVTRFDSLPQSRTPLICSPNTSFITFKSNHKKYYNLFTPNLRVIRAMATQSEKHKSLYDFTVKDAKGNDVDLSKYKGKVLLVVNVASECGLANSNYPELGKLYEKYKDQGLEILAFPCNQFGNQEPGNNEQILEFACTRFKAEFPIFDKVDVNGETADPLYKFLKANKGGIFGDSIKWNFAKFLVDKEGNVVGRHAPTTSPLSFENEIKKLLTVA